MLLTSQTTNAWVLAAVEGGGVMGLLPRRLGFVQLAEPQRFAAAWERRATLGLRAGDKAVLRDYEQHGRLRGGTTEQAYRGWLAEYLDGKDTILIARTEDQVRELSRRAREDLDTVTGAVSRSQIVPADRPLTYQYCARTGR